MEGNSKLAQEKRQIGKDEKGDSDHRKTRERHDYKRRAEKEGDNLKYFKKPFHKKKHHFRRAQEAQENHIPRNDDRSNDKHLHKHLEIKQASNMAKEKLSEALSKKANTVVSVSKVGNDWNVIIEIIDEEYLPGRNLESMNDIIGVYDVKLSEKGELLSWNKKSSRRRGNTSG